MHHNDLSHAEIFFNKLFSQMNILYVFNERFAND